MDSLSQSSESAGFSSADLSGFSRRVSLAPPERGTEMDATARILAEAQTAALRVAQGRRFHSDVLSERSLEQLLQQSPGRLLIVGKKLADEIRLPLDEVPEGDRCVIVVQGAAD